MGKIIVIGGGWAGIAAAITARKTGNQVTLLERTDLLLGLGNVGGIMRNNGRYTAAEENIAMGAWELFDITDKMATHRNVDFPGHNHASFYNVLKVEPAVKSLLTDMGVEVKLNTRILNVNTSKRLQRGLVHIDSLVDDKDNIYEGDCFIDCTGTTGPMGNCLEYGNGCVMCIMRCPAFGPRMSISSLAGGKDYMGKRLDGNYGAMSGSGKLIKETLSRSIQKQLTKKGFAVIPLPDELVNEKKLKTKVCRQYALPQFAKNIILIDTGHAKIMTPYFPLEELRKIEGFENARYADPYAGGKGNSVRFMAITEREKDMRVKNIANLYCGGEKSGPYIGHTEAISTGSLAGYNAGRFVQGKAQLILDEETAIGSLINYPAGEEMITFAGDRFFQHMQEKGLYTIDKEAIGMRIRQKGLLNIYENLAP